MKKLAESFEQAAAASPAVRFVDVALRGVGQVMFQDNPLSGLLFLVAILWGALAAGQPAIALSGVLALVVAAPVALWLRVDASAYRAGLFGFNAVLVGLALATFLAPGPVLYGFVVLGAATSVVATLAITTLLRPYGVAGLTFPFVLTTWIFLLASHGFAGVTATALPSGAVVAPAAILASDLLHPIDFVLGVLSSIGQVFLKASWISGLLLVAGLAVNSVRAAVFAVLGALIAVAVAHLFGAESDLVTGGLLGFSPVLTAIALGAVFLPPSTRSTVIALIAAVVTVIAQAAFNAAMAPFALPALTMPFVLVTWLVLLAPIQGEAKA